MELVAVCPPPICLFLLHSTGKVFGYKIHLVNYDIHFSSMKWRGAFLSLFALMVGFGILLCYSLGIGLYWRYVATVPPILYILLAIGLCLIPESPIWLLGHKGESEAREALQWIR